MTRPLAVLAGCLALFGQSRETNPYKLTDAEALGKGRQLYSYYCVFCHGMDGVSGRGAQLASTYRKHGSSDREMYRTIADGVPGTEMSGHWLEEDEIWKILLFVRQFERSAGAAGAGCGSGGGDAVRGAGLFRQNGCGGCHSTSSRLGPNLAGIGSTHSRAHLRESIVDPSKAVARQYRVASVRTKAGQSYRGLLLNQDEYTIHLLDTAERIRSFRRSDLAATALPTESLMPAYAGKLSDAQMDDLIAHLCAGGSR
ncbi:MAG: c-type cytochrome [Bryobacteraceae bacterium]